MVPPSSKTQEPPARQPAADAEAERLELLAQVHDGPLQLLLTALQELDAADEDAHARGRVLVGYAARDLRGLLDPASAPAGVGSARQVLEDWCALSCARTGCAWSVVVNTELGPDEHLVVSAARELVTNAARHASCTRLDVTIERTPTGVVLDVRDDGVGFPAGAPLGYGLRSLTRRLDLVGGQLHRHRPVSGGCCVQVVLPGVGA